MQQGEGVGDDEYSFAFDGFRKKKWHRALPENYGRKWRAGDTIGCYLSIESKTAVIGFEINGEDLGIAFEGIDVEAGRDHVIPDNLVLSSTLYDLPYVQKQGLRLPTSYPSIMRH